MRLFKRLVIAWLSLSVVTLVVALVVRKRVPAFGSEDDDEFSVVATMEGRSFASRARGLVHGRVTAFMAGVELDLTEAQLDAGASIGVCAAMGGIDIIVPPTWRVEVTAKEVMGAVVNLTDPDAVDDDAPLVLIDATVVMGGVEIHRNGGG